MVLVLSSNGTYTKLTTLEEARTAAFVAGKTVVVTSPQVVTTAIVWPTDRTLEFKEGGYVTFSGSGALTGLPYVRPEWFGAKGDSVTDDLIALRKIALMQPTKVIFSPGKTYLVSDTVVWGDNIHLTGGGTIKTTGQSAFDMGNASKVSNLTFDSMSALFPMWAVSNDSKMGLTVDGCSFLNGRIYLKNSLGVASGDVKIINNAITADYSAYNYTVDQIDPMSFFGQNGVLISNNTIKVTNVHRVIKLSDAYYTGQPVGVVSPFPTMNVTISKNKITGTTTSNKQVIDAYMGTSNVLLDGNHIDVTGFGVIFQNKTGEGTSNGTPINTSITNNFLKNDKQLIEVQGSVGATVTANDNHDCNLIMSGNITETSITAGVSIRFYTSIQMFGNNCELTGLPNGTVLQLLQTKTVKINNNIIDGGLIQISMTSTNHAGASYSMAVFGDVEIISNTLKNWANTEAGISIISFNSPDHNIIISKNISTPGTITSGTNRFFYTNGVTAKQIQITNNIFNGLTATPIWSGINNVFITSSGNNWEPTTTYGQAVPTSQVYLKGARIINTNTGIGSVKAWAVTTAGGATSSTRIDSTPYVAGVWVKWTTGATIWSCTTAGTSNSAVPDITGKIVGDIVTDGTVVWTLRSLTAAVFTSEGVL